MDAIDIARYFGALILVLGLVGMAWIAARRYGVPGMARPNSTKRLAVVETLMLDARHKLLLIRRDDSEHLIVLGPQGAFPIPAAQSEASNPLTLSKPGEAAA